MWGTRRNSVVHRIHLNFTIIDSDSFQWVTANKENNNQQYLNHVHTWTLTAVSGTGFWALTRSTFSTWWRTVIRTGYENILFRKTKHLMILEEQSNSALTSYLNLPAWQSKYDELPMELNLPEVHSEHVVERNSRANVPGILICNNS